MIEDAQVLPTTDENKEEVTSAKEETPNNTVKLKGLTGEIFNQLVAYLNTKPHSEVRGLIDSLSSSPVIDVTLVNAPQGN